MNNKIILIEDLINNKERKEQELKFYREKLEELQKKVDFLQLDIDLTNKIIKIIEEENVVEVKADD